MSLREHGSGETKGGCGGQRLGQGGGRHLYGAQGRCT